MSVKKLLTFEQLVEFWESNNLKCFNSKDTGYTLSVQVPGKLVFSNSESEDLMYTTVKVCHTLLNRNQSYISEENMKKAMPTLKYKPLLASIIENEDGELDFNGHDMEVLEDEEGNSYINYIEKQVGTFTTKEPYLEYDKDADKTYVIAEAVIPRGYTQTAEIIERKNGTKVSCELCIDSMSYNSKEKYLELEDFYFSGVTLLGEHVGEGMLGSRLDIKDFSTENNSVKFEKDDRIVELLQQLSDKIDNLSGYTKEDLKEGGKTPMSKFEELLEQYGKTAEEIEFDYSEMSDEELEAKFAELFDGDGDDTDDPDDTSENDEPAPQSDETEVPDESDSNGDGFDDEEVAVDSNDEKKKVEYSVVYGEVKKEFSVSLSDIIFALSELVNDTYADDCAYYGVEVYADDNYVIMQDYWSGKAYKQSFKKKKDCYSLVGDRVPVKAVFLTEDEEKALDDMRNNYSSISEKFEEVKSKLNKYEEEPSKMEVLNSEEYAQISSIEEFEAFKVQEAHFDMSIEEVRAHADEMLLNYAKSGSLKFAEAKEVGMKKIPTISKKTGRYGNLFSK